MYIQLSVDCNCIRNRKLKPVPEEFRPYLRFDDNIIYLDYTGDAQAAAADHDREQEISDEQHEIIDPRWTEWLESACEHENGFHAYTGTIGPQNRLISLIRVLQEMPDAGLQNLLSAVSSNDDLEIVPEQAAGCLVELYQFKSNFPRISGTVVKDEESGTVLDILIGDEVRSLYTSENYQVGCDRHGIWVTRHGSPGSLPEFLFHSAHFRQDLLAFCTGLLIDKASGEYIEIGHPVFPKENNSYPAEITIRFRELTPADFSYLTDPFNKAFKASVETGNPVSIRCDRSAVDL